MKKILYVFLITVVLIFTSIPAFCGNPVAVTALENAGFKLVNTVTVKDKGIYILIKGNHLVNVVYRDGELLYTKETFPITLNQLNNGMTLVVLQGYKAVEQPIKDGDGIVTLFYKDTPDQKIKRKAVGFKQTFTGQYYEIVWNYFKLGKR